MSHKFISSTLSKNEKILHVFDLHWFVWIKSSFLIILGLALLTHTGFGLIFVFLGIISILGVLGTEYGITNSRIVGKTGFIFRKNIDLRLSKVESVILDQGIFGRLFGYGNIIFNGTGSGKNGFFFVKNPILIKNQINQVIDNLENKN